MAASVFAMSCRGGDAGSDHNRDGSDVGGTLIVAMPADVATLLPPYASTTQEKMAADILFDRLAQPGDSLNTIGDHGFIPQLAERWEWLHDSLAIAFHLNPRAKWHDGVPVRASDVEFT